MNLKDKAKKLGIEFDDDIEDADLQKLIDVKEKEIEEENDVEFHKAEAKKAYAKRDEERKDKKKLQTKLADLEKAMAEAPNADEFKTLKEKFAAIEADETKKKEETEKAELAKKTETELLEIRFKKELDNLKNQMEGIETAKKDALAERDKVNEELKGNIESLKRDKMQGEILKSAVKHKALRPDQIVRLTKDDFVFDNTLEKFVYHKKDAKNKIVDELTIDERIKEFLDDEENDNLVESPVGNTSLHTTTRTTEPEGKIKIDTSGRKTGEYDPNDEYIKAEAVERNLEVTDLIDIWKMRDERLSQRKEVK